MIIPFTFFIFWNLREWENEIVLVSFVRESTFLASFSILTWVVTQSSNSHVAWQFMIIKLGNKYVEFRCLGKDAKMKWNGGIYFAISHILKQWLT